MLQYMMVKEMTTMDSYAHGTYTSETTDGVMLPYYRFIHLHAIAAL